ncbi:hypothetical protein JB92DRAFT_2895084 [Gautieria morchelliformis]|nr:hypothetical protein JB92DRAFT_2895084 [Gautieria morchelliformis]
MYLPFEVWSHVFCQLPNNSQIQLMRVCQFWRHISKATPQLWTHLHIGHTHQFDDPSGLWQWLEKSGECPLDVVLKVPLGVTDLRPTLVLLHSHVRRFRVLNMDVPTPGIADTILSSIALSEGKSNGNTAPLLEELCIAIEEMSDMPADENQDYFEHAFYPSPRLRRLTISPLRIPAPSSKLLSTVSALMIVSGPNDQVTPIQRALNTIAAIPRLKYLKYSGYHFFSFQASHSLDYPRVEVLPHLEEVHVTVPGCGLDILQCLEAPTLRSVCLDGSREDGYAEDWDDEGVTHVSASLKRLPQRAPHIQRLDIHRIEELQADTCKWLFSQTDFAHLEELRIEGSTMTDEAFSQSSSLGPCLRRLELIDCEDITGNALIAYIEARQPSGLAGDFQLLASGCPGVEAKHLAELSRFVTVEGVDD